MNRKPIKKLVDRADWQSLRKSLLGTWKDNPTGNIRKLKSWLGPISKAPTDKLRIVMNYLTGTGFRTGKIKHPSISKLRDDISNELKNRKKALKEVFSYVK